MFYVPGVLTIAACVFWKSVPQGGRILGKGMEKLFDFPIELIETDISFGPWTMAIVDAHNIPFVATSFDGVVIQVVLEHVADLYTYPKEIYRVLKPEGLVYAETTFIQQEHEIKFDFTRFTLPGHRRLFSRFQEVESGAVYGTGMALLWGYEYFLMA